MKIHIEKSETGKPADGAADESRLGAMPAVPPSVGHMELRHSIYETLSRECGFTIRFGKQTCFDHKKGVVVLGVSDLDQLRNSRSPALFDLLVDFDVMHELGHLKELHDDPDGYMMVINESKKSKYGPTIFRLYNCLMDIYVNTNTANRAPVYRDGQGFSKPVEDYYRQLLFSKRDLSKGPKCTQFSDYLLQLGMGVAGDIKLSPRVQEIIDAGIELPLGQGKVSYQKFIDTFLKPVLNRKAAWQATISQRKALIDQTIRPIFEKLIEEDIKDGVPTQKISSEPGDGDGEDCDADAEPQENGKPGTGRPIKGMNAGDLKKFLEWAKAAKDEKGKTAEQKAAEAAAKAVSDMAAENKVPQEVVDDYLETSRRMKPVTNSLFELWKRLRKPTIDWELGEGAHSPRGVQLDVNEAIRQYGHLQKSPSTAPVMIRKDYFPKQVWKPNLLRLWVVPDLSGSMADNMPQVRDMCVALCESLVKTTYETTASKATLNCILNVVGFDEETHVIIENSKETHIKDILKGYAELYARGGTSDHVALAHVMKAITPQDIAAIRKGEQIDILIEITDGDTSFPGESRRRLAELQAAGLHVIGIRINGAWRPDKEEKRDGPDGFDRRPMAPLQPPPGAEGQFDQIWNSGSLKRGYHIWRAKDLLSALQKALEQVLKKVTED